MAVVFISPKKKQKGFFMGITISLALFLSVISFWVFLAQPSVQEQKTTLNKPKVNVNLAILDSEQFKNLENFELMPLQFEYTAMTSRNKIVQGVISAVSEEKAREILQTNGYSVSELKLIDIGRDNPFVPY
ncbi:MAG: hypothetical protein A2599_02365 [Candidatus Staskawiczbacteria bacterium RIFOXYD1_FULL_39_28]|uniref:Uncharacterized protein n=1 Tax=Candidatus Staskawiczbacteria bacterium RIFOXYC1_FULL_38_18 TaxID=1802229 RepID=A0A1G2J9E4_9BACT|nr:MAG: hypothetical protein A2401_01975 [Candidatus Staskawiczbacteria bacterium RIFOXYC1_FULL_38_18]OGZ89922.1 MAG: hypothetical protein A2599_02365 [Candidatus Staskawiczbacteria bacterium RIFOXYD1_FULL_39_28]